MLRLLKKCICKTKFRGSAALLLTVATAAMVSAIALSLVKINSAGSTKLLLSKRQMQAQQYALTEADLVKALRYDDISRDRYNLKTYGASIIPGSDYYKDVYFSDEDYDDGGTTVDTLRSMVVTIDIYHKSNLVYPVFSVEVPRYSREKNSYVPVGTIIGWAGSGTPSNEDGTWIECDGSGCLLYGSLMKILKDRSGFAPDFSGRYLCGGDATTVGTTLEQKLPGLQSYFELNFLRDKTYDYDYYGTGECFTFGSWSVSRYAIDSSKRITREERYALWFKPEDMYNYGPRWARTGSEPVYDNDVNVVRPKTAVVRYFMKAD